MSSTSLDFAFEGLLFQIYFEKFKNVKTDEIIGVEVVNLIIKSERQETTAKLNKIARNVCLKLSQFSKLNYCIFLTCNNGNYAKINIKTSDYVNKIYKIITEDTDIKIGKTRNVNFKLKDNNILQLSYSINESNYNFPGTSDGGVVHNNPYDLLISVINAKNNKYNNYRKKCNKCVLLIVSDNLAGNSSFIEFDDTLEQEVFQTEFNEIFLYEFGGMIHHNSRKLNIEKIF
jgi:hypothetical protein